MTLYTRPHYEQDDLSVFLRNSFGIRHSKIKISYFSALTKNEINETARFRNVEFLEKKFFIFRIVGKLTLGWAIFLCKTLAGIL